MKKHSRKILFVLTFVLLVTFIPAMHVSAAHDVFTATLMGQLDTDVNAVVDEWGIADLENASVGFSIGEAAIIYLEFEEPIKFTGERVRIITSVPVIGYVDAESTNAQILSFIVDGNDLGSLGVPLISYRQLTHSNEGFLAFDIANQWDGSHDSYDLAGMEPFSTLEIVFVVNNRPAGMEDEDTSHELDIPINEPEPVDASVTPINDVITSEDDDYNDTGRAIRTAVIFAVVIAIIGFILFKFKKK